MFEKTLKNKGKKVEMLKERAEGWSSAQYAEAIARNGAGPEAYTDSSKGTSVNGAEQPTKELTAAICIAAMDADLKAIADTLATLWAELEELQRVTQ